MPTAPSSPTAAPTAPDRTDRPTFSARATAWANYQKDSLVPQMYALATNAYANAVEANASAVAALASQSAAAASEINAAAYANSTGTSAQNKTIAVAQFTFTDVPTGRAWVAGMPVVAYANATNYMLCTVNSYSGSTLVLDAGAVVGSGAFSAWSFFGQPYPRYPIFAAAAASVSGVSSGEVLENELVSTGLAASGVQAIFGNSLFLVATTASSANIASSPDGDIFTLRAMPSTAAWNIATNGTNKFVATVPGATTTAKSTDGTTWSAATALGATAKTTYGIPVFNGDTCLVLASTAATAYTSTDNGTTWTPQTLPANSGSCAPFVVGGLFWYYSATNVAYTSATGATGTWTARTLSVTPVHVFQDFDGALLYTATYTYPWYRTADGITSAASPAPALPASGSTWVALRLINGVYATFNGPATFSRTTHNGAWVDRRSNVSDDVPNVPGVSRCAKNTAGTIFLVPHSAGTTGLIGRIAPAATDARTALFSR